VHEIRRIQIQLSPLQSSADGSALFQIGNTKVLASVFGPKEVERRSMLKTSEAVLTCEFQLAPFSNPERSYWGENSRRTKEIESTLTRTFEAIVLTDSFPRSQIQICVQVLQNDGGLIAACINAASLALINAGVPMKEFVVCCAAGFLNSQAVIDLNGVETSTNSPELLIGVLSESHRVGVMEMKSKIPINHIDDLMVLAAQGCIAIGDVMKAAIQDFSYSKQTNISH
jgi:exosome complex component RRP41